MNPDPASSWSPHQVFNLGGNNTIELMDFISILEKEIGKKAIKEFLPMQPGDGKLLQIQIVYLNTQDINQVGVSDGIKNLFPGTKNIT